MINRLDQKWYPKFIKNWDDGLFREKILSQLKPYYVVLDLGAGAGIVEQMNFRGKVAKMCGVDLDPRVQENQMLDEGKLADAERIPYDDNSFDVVFSDNVLEHLECPDNVFKEVNRVLKPGGIYLFKTPNKWHYVPTIYRITPHKFHQYINRKRGRDSDDTFPTHYKANSKSDVIALANRNNFIVEFIELVEGRPEYLRLHWSTYFIGFSYERLVNSVNILQGFRILLIGCIRKKS
jgi:SAM-dependent methyltransferase